MSASTVTDAELLRRVADGDEAALRELVERHTPWLSLRLRRRVGDADVVDDVLQDTFVAAWRSAGGWRGDGEVAAWLWGIAVRRLVSRLRVHRVRTVSAATEVLERIVGSVASAEDDVLLGVEHGDLAAALDGLSPELRAVVQATLVDGLTTREAGTLLGIPQGTVKSRMRAARSALRGALTQGRLA